ncbi:MULTISPECIES: YceI family protein [Sphingobium]|uniref:Polyisoprenoid-binding protein YceI n=1 Tax=Sphingobium xenophagum TaxID=121428 RepID=A0ABU1X0F8_SPHXE|nr:YceI family protein [Sphingobium xenophagum]MDR7155065.1 polyisoprenoid-binding protein YceI [Sphingobium xenophagum]
MKKYLIPAAALVAIAGGSMVIAQAPTGVPGAKDVAKVSGGSYKVDGGHTQVVFAYDHMGFTNNVGIFAEPTGTLTLDKANPSASTVSIEIPIANLKTGVTKLDEHLLKADFFDVAKFPTAKFVSTSVKAEGTGATITGNLTIKDITKPVTLDAEFYGAGANPMNKQENVGFVATGSIKRSDFGLGYAVPVVGDAVELKIIAGFQK